MSADQKLILAVLDAVKELDDGMEEMTRMTSRDPVRHTRLMDQLTDARLAWREAGRPYPPILSAEATLSLDPSGLQLLSLSLSRRRRRLLGSINSDFTSMGCSGRRAITASTRSAALRHPGFGANGRERQNRGQNNMKKIPGVFKRDYTGNRQVIDEVVEGCEWVLAGEGRPTVKWDGTCCMIRDGRLFKRYDRKLKKSVRKAWKQTAAGDEFAFAEINFKPAPTAWEAAEETPNLHTGHWPGWVPVGDGPEDRWHREAWVDLRLDAASGTLPADGTYELCGPKVQGNPHGFKNHLLIVHGDRAPFILSDGDCRHSFDEIRLHLVRLDSIEGIIWHHPDGRKAKIKRKDFGLAWPPEKETVHV